MGLVSVTPKNRPQFVPRILEIEAEAEYPLGNDSFRIDHGKDYFRFFDRLGDLKYYIWKEDGQVAAAAAGILRRVPLGAREKGAWYLSDLKVRKAFRGRKIPLRMLSRAFLPNYLRCPRGYAISMNSPGADKNRIARMLSHFRWAATKEAARLLLWSLTETEMRTIRPVLEKHRGPVRFLSLGGVKDIVLRSTGRPMPLVHAQFGPLADSTGSTEVVEGAVHMFCSPEADALSREVVGRGLAPSATASVIAHRMHTDWTWILTSDI